MILVLFLLLLAMYHFRFGLIETSKAFNDVAVYDGGHTLIARN